MSEPFNGIRMAPAVRQKLEQRMTPCQRRGKHAHPSFGAAEAHLRSLRKRYDDIPKELLPYRCPLCHQWHLGRKN